MIAGHVGHPFLIILFGFNNNFALHVVMEHSAELRAGHIVLANFVGREMNCDRHSRYGVLFQPESGNKETVDDIL
jgi:hypothetical protein